MHSIPQWLALTEHSKGKLCSTMQLQHSLTLSSASLHLECPRQPIIAGVPQGPQSISCVTTASIQGSSLEAAVDALLVLLTTLALGPTLNSACIYLYGSREAAPGGLWGYGYRGKDWASLGFAGCNGTLQSPLNLATDTAYEPVPQGEDTRLNYGVLRSIGKNVQLTNTGHTVQLSWDKSFMPDVTIAVRGEAATARLTSRFQRHAMMHTSASTPIRRVHARPLQLHFHTNSEHLLAGIRHPLELHIVHHVPADVLPGCGSGGCFMVLAALFQLAPEGQAGSDFLDTVFKHMPMTENSSAALPAGATLDFDSLLPRDKSYLTFEGSLTTPPCTEGILWVVLTTPGMVTTEQLDKLQLAVGDTDCKDSMRASGGLTGACTKLQNGQNYRNPQHANGRLIQLHYDHKPPDQDRCMHETADALMAVLGPEVLESRTLTVAQHQTLSQLAAAAGPQAACISRSGRMVHGLTSILELLLLGCGGIAIGWVLFGCFRPDAQARLAHSLSVYPAGLMHKLHYSSIQQTNRV